MTPKEKAIELVDKFKYISYDLDDIENHKEGALIAVDEIIYSYPTDPFNTLQPTGIVPLYYWREVKQEIEKL